MDRAAFGILQVNTRDCEGGAARIAWNLFKEYERKGLKSYLAVGYKQSSDPGVIHIPDNKNKISQIIPLVVKCFRLPQHFGNILAHPTKIDTIIRGYEDFNFPGTWDLLDLIPSFRPDIIHCHNLHGNYFDLRALPSLGEQVPLVLTLHDAWLISGHCAHSFSCEKWQTGCGNCPDLAITPAIKRDATASNWRRKKEIFKEMQIYIASPSQWLADKIKKSILKPAIKELKIIPNGVNLDIFHPLPKEDARRDLGLPQDKKIILFTARGIKKNRFKDYTTMRLAIEYVAQEYSEKNLLFLALGEKSASERIGDARIQFIPYQFDPKKVARFYQAADIYIHAAHIDTFPNTILEALACGTPVIASSVGGIPEQVDDAETGFLTLPGDAESMAEKILLLIDDDNLCRVMGKKGSDTVREKFDLKLQANEYLSWYEKILNEK